MISALTPLLNHPQAISVLTAMQNAGFEIRFVGGCVRDCLLNRALGDIDMATNALPEQIIQTLEKAGIKTIPTGIDHGTVTAVIDKASFEVTTLRHDISGDGRHAEVEFTDSWELDAHRRDFTVNALSADINGKIYDYCGGEDDLWAKNLRFIDDAESRIHEDYLRLLRYFRFASTLDWDIAQSDTFDICAKLAPKLQTLSRERVQSELYKLLMGHGAIRIAGLMQEHQIWAALYPYPVDMSRFIACASQQDADAFCRLLALTGWQHIDALEKFIVLSRDQKKRIQSLHNVQNVVDEKPLEHILYFHGKQAVLDYFHLHATDWNHTDIVEWHAPVFPLRAEHIIDIAGGAGPQLGAMLKQAEIWWVENHFKPGLDRLVSHCKNGH